MSNCKLNKARNGKKDECYTREQDIRLELEHYNFNGMSVYSPCDDYRFSSFTQFFVENFHKLGLTKYCCTNYNIGDGAYKFEYDGRNTFITELQGDGDFQSEECTRIRDEYDMVVTNPPFSIAKEFIPWASEKKYLIVANHNVITSNPVFPILKDNNIWVGASSKNTGMWFCIPDEYDEFQDIDSDGRRMIRVSEACWLTNMENDKCYNNLTLTKCYNSTDYPTYDDCDAIEVSRVTDIPCDYYGLMGVPVTFIYKYNPDQFEIIEHGSFSLNGKITYHRLIIRRKKTQSNIARKSDNKRITRKQIGSYNYPFVSDYDKFSVDKESILSHKPIEHLYLRGSPQRKKQREAA